MEITVVAGEIAGVRISTPIAAKYADAITIIDKLVVSEQMTVRDVVDSIARALPAWWRRFQESHLIIMAHLLGLTQASAVSLGGMAVSCEDLNELELLDEPIDENFVDKFPDRNRAHCLRVSVC